MILLTGKLKNWPQLCRQSFSNFREENYGAVARSRPDSIGAERGVTSHWPPNATHPRQFS